MSYKEHIFKVSNFHDLVTTPFIGNRNAICWSRKLKGDFLEIIQQFELTENIIELNEEDLLGVTLSPQGQLARSILLEDFHQLKAHGAAPSLNIIRQYERDTELSFFPTDVYSFHVDRSPIPTATILCTYYGAASEFLPNNEVDQKVLIPEIRAQLKGLYDGKESEFESFLEECFFDLHYAPKPFAQPISLGVGNMWRLSVDHPQSEALPCVHRAPIENKNEPRLLLIC